MVSKRSGSNIKAHRCQNGAAATLRRNGVKTERQQREDAKVSKWSGGNMKTKKVPKRSCSNSKAVRQCKYWLPSAILGLLPSAARQERNTPDEEETTSERHDTTRSLRFLEKLAEALAILCGRCSQHSWCQPWLLYTAEAPSEGDRHHYSQHYQCDPHARRRGADRSERRVGAWEWPFITTTRNRKVNGCGKDQ